MKRRFTMTFDREFKRLFVNPEDGTTVAWLKEMPLELFAELDALGREIARLQEPFHLGLLPARAAEYEQKMRALFPDETIEVRAAGVPVDRVQGEDRMTKPHEETWTWAAQYQHVETPEGGDIGIFVDDRILDESEKARLVLAAQAPAMARLLLEIQWGRNDGGDNPSCSICGWHEPTHDPDCKVPAVLRAAGVLP